MNNHNTNNLHSDSNHDEDSNDISTAPDANDDTHSTNDNTVNPRARPRITIITVSSNRIKNKQENDDEELCRCGDPNSHKDECSLYCGLAPCHDKLVQFPKCSHYIHETCLEQLLCTRLSKCPLCRSPIDSWRRSRHYQQIEEEIAHQFQSDTEQAILLSQKMYEQEQRKQNAAKRESRSGNRDREESERGNRERSRSRERHHSDHSNDRGNRDRYYRDRNRNHSHREHRERYDRNNNNNNSDGRHRSWNRNNRRYST